MGRGAHLMREALCLQRVMTVRNTEFVVSHDERFEYLRSGTKFAWHLFYAIIA